MTRTKQAIFYTAADAARDVAIINRTARSHGLNPGGGGEAWEFREAWARLEAARGLLEDDGCSRM